MSLRWDFCITGSVITLNNNLQCWQYKNQLLWMNLNRVHSCFTLSASHYVSVSLRATELQITQSGAIHRCTRFITAFKLLHLTPFSTLSSSLSLIWSNRLPYSLSTNSSSNRILKKNIINPWQHKKILIIMDLNIIPEPSTRLLGFIHFHNLAFHKVI